MKDIALGLMSGTSADGISIAACRFSAHQNRLLSYKTYPYPTSIRKNILRSIELRTPAISQLNMVLGQFFAQKTQEFIKQFRLKVSQIAVIGSHGQTIYHGPKDRVKNTLQIGEPCLLAEHTGIPVVADFRMRDIAAGGDGAPLMPFFDQYFFAQKGLSALQNIGGIANVTLVGKTIKPMAFDNGPGNCLLDLAIQKKTKNHLQFDRDGKIAARGNINSYAVKQMARHPYFFQKPPKSTGRELFNEKFIPANLWRDSLENLLATLTYFTALIIQQSYDRFLPPSIQKIIVSGGGAFNKTLMNHLAQLMTPMRIQTIKDYGIPAQAKEPMAFAFFAWLAINGKINHLPSGTGAKRACILGKIIPGSSKWKS